jgi:hypothetical protein
MANVTLHDCLDCKHHCFECGDHKNPDTTIYCGLDGEHKLKVDEWNYVIVLGCNKGALNEI